MCRPRDGDAETSGYQTALPTSVQAPFPPRPTGRAMFSYMDAWAISYRSKGQSLFLSANQTVTVTEFFSGTCADDRNSYDSGGPRRPQYQRGCMTTRCSPKIR